MTKPWTSWTRRSLLRGASVALALPWLESLPAGDPAPGAKAAATAGPPRRFASFFVGNGVLGWDAKTDAAGLIELGPALMPFSPHLGDITILQGLQHSRMLKESKVNTHGSLAPNILSGAVVRHSTTDIYVATSMDQILAERIGGSTLLPSLVMGCEPPCPGVDTGLSSVYLNHISWSSPTRPTPREIHPALVFDALVGKTGDRLRTASILDQVLSDAAELGRDLGAGDRQRMDEYLSSVRDVERRVQRSSEPAATSGWKPTLAAPDLPRPPDGVPKDLAAHMKLMLDLLVLAFRMDRTRIATLMLTNERSTLDFTFVPGVPGDQYHPISHSGKGHMEITRFLSQQVADFVAKMKAIDEGGRSLLDNSMILFLSAMRSGGAHSAVDLPVLLAGRGGGSLTSGRLLKYDEKSGRQMCSLYLSLMDRMGVELKEFGDATTRLKDF
ncbi:hypothetical protein LBMAG53_07150 [Planctomycetota bacterium]|nr:hypothetical protein LBMAG53_07150 [Planctomycetota bacterium]